MSPDEMPLAPLLRIVPFRPELAPAFARLNLEWIERFFTLEAPDRAVLDDPEATIIAEGGQIFFALLDQEVVGTAAAIRHDARTFELAKMGVTPRAQGRGAGRRLSEAAIAFAREAGAHKVVLLTNSRLVPALHLYEALGFQHAPIPLGNEYARADVYMELPLEPVPPAST